jgi:mannitol-specific phosphotransferase system IIBC component
MDRLHPTENQGTHDLSTTETMGMNNSPTSRVYIIISFSCLAIALFVGAVASLTVTAIILKRRKEKTRAVSVQPNRTEEITRNEPGYENVTLSPLSSVSAINTQDNVAYGHTRTSTRRGGVMQDVAMYESVIGPLPLVSTIDTQDNVAYGCTQQL